jgi:glycerophosphoryl diester phosphodiesterase
MKRLEPRITTGLLVGQRNPPADPLVRVRECRADYYAPAASLITAEMVSRLHGAGIPLVAWTVNDPDEARRLVELGVGTLPGDTIISDYPDRLLDMRRSLQAA